jgi:hypothetical protein
MMLKFIPLTALALGLSSGVALADHRGGGPRGGGDHRAAAVEHHGGGYVARDHHDFRGGGGVVVRDHRDFRGGGGVVREGREWRGGGRVVVRDGGWRGGYYASRRPIYVGRPIIRERYYDYYRRPAVIVENYNPMAGYYWVPGAWQWNGNEWMWQPGHYEPDPNYTGYYDGY